MIDTRTIATTFTEGAQAHTGFAALAFAAMTVGALTGWSRLCEAEKVRARARAHLAAAAVDGHRMLAREPRVAPTTS